MKLLVTGSSGTLGTAVNRAAVAAGHQFIGWNRQAADPLTPASHPAYIDAIAPDAILHLAVAATSTGRDNEGWRTTVDWSLGLADYAAQRGLPLVFTSTALVFDNSLSGPFTLASATNAREGYGFEKRCAEHGVLLRHPGGARVARLGWQIDPQGSGNNMVAHAHREMAAHGAIGASRRWQPACSFVDDTATALLRLIDAPPGLYMLDSNRDGASFADILRALSQTFGYHWQIAENEDYVYDQRLIDPRHGMPALAVHLPSLAR
ncbi:sugar nucleotide-binding protein [Niveibacterium sp. 24ML]|uniref:sugar nucleotide-binding protein n=1 Tax=Niveibacterium sp. 24ML TaxID=2985512 RepID=UPI002271FD3A|nr:sugar nucleotide-binding protein [Niveibacterium sp. 24ML]MCX9158172.1 sugar nucleotide-binding protein [Niveibacterium sp. 24ML]